MQYRDMRYLSVLLALVPTLVLCAPEPLKFPDSSSDSTAASSIPEEQGARDASRAIEEILAAARAGRSVGIRIGNADLDNLASDPELKKLASGSDVPEGRSSSASSGGSRDSQARNYISTKLCSLGLAKCGEQRHYGGSASYNGIRDVTLVQPVALKPVGHPIAAIPLSPGSSGGSLPFSPISGSRDKSYDNQYYPSESQGGFVQSGNQGCTCVPVSHCNSYDIVSGPGGSSNSNYQPPYNPSNNNNGNYYPRPGNDYNNNNNNQGFITGNGRPSYGQVGHGIDPRNKLDSNIESNATVVEAAPSTTLNARALPETSSDESVVTEVATANRTRREAPRVINGANNNCYDRQVCCRNPVRPVNKNPSIYPGGGTTNYPPPYYPNNNNNNNNNYPPPSNNQNGVCGRRNAYGINGRVLNGAQSNYGIGNGDTEFGEYPWQVAILRKEGADNVFVCGGSLIDSRHVLTAAHCIQSHRPQTLRVRLGDWDVGGETEFYPHQDLDVAAIAVHPDFNSGNLFNDIALVKLDGYVDTGRYPHISPICLPDKYYDFTGKRCIVTGWGKDAWGQEGKFQHRLKEVDLPVLNHYDCEQKLKRTRLGSNFVLHPGFLCAGGEPSRDACKGDGGGPLACEVGGVWQLAGIISWGVGCGIVDTPGVYVKTANYHDWIRQNIGY